MCLRIDSAQELELRQDGKGPVFIMNVVTIEEARAIGSASSRIGCSDHASLDYFLPCSSE